MGAFARWLFAVISGVVIVALLLYATVLRSSFYHPYFEQRSAVGAKWQQDGFTVAVVWPRHTDKSFVEGVKTALDEINASKSVWANKVRLKVYEEDWDSSGDTGAEIAQKVVQDPKVLAVLGHEVSASAIPASVTYETHGLLFLTPKSTDPRLTTHNFLYTFRLTPDDEEIAREMVKFAKDQGWNKVGLLYARSPMGDSFAPQVSAAVADAGVEMAFMRSFVARDRNWKAEDFRPMIAEIEREDFDAILVADQLPRLAKLVIDLRKMGIKKPIIANDKADSSMLWDIAGAAANEVYVASVVDPSSTTPRYVNFKERFRRQWGEDPGYGASQGYECMMLLADAGVESDSADPLVVASTLRSYVWQGLFGEFRFSKNGDVEGRQITIKRLQNARFTTVAALRTGGAF
jgi:branched-chain amino acid transport system substrate-binding protein